MMTVISDAMPTAHTVFGCMGMDTVPILISVIWLRFFQTPDTPADWSESRLQQLPSTDR
jgi:hypothetical protein